MCYKILCIGKFIQYCTSAGINVYQYLYIRAIVKYIIYGKTKEL